MLACVACQPIFNIRQQVFGYELLYRAGESSQAYDGIDGNLATRKVMETAFSDIGIQELTGGRKAFVNFTEDLLLEEAPCLLSSDILVVEVLETVEPTKKVVDVCHSLQSKGYLIALDDFDYREEYEPLIECADIIKIDFMATDRRRLPQLVRKLGHNGRKILLAEKIETVADYELAKALGFSLVQGYFFCKPKIHVSRHVDPLKASQLQLVRFLGENDVNFAHLAEIIKHDVVLSYRLLRIVNSAYYGLQYSVTGILHALTILGVKELRKWIALIVMNEIRDDKPNELMRTALMRGLFMEQLAVYLHKRKERDEYFMAGLFSLADVLMDAPMHAILQQTHLSQELTDALVTGEGRLADLLQIIVHYERGEWEEALSYAAQYQISPDTVLRFYTEALTKSNQVLR